MQWGATILTFSKVPSAPCCRPRPTREHLCTVQLLFGIHAAAQSHTPWADATPLNKPDHCTHCWNHATGTTVVGVMNYSKEPQRQR